MRTLKTKEIKKLAEEFNLKKLGIGVSSSPFVIRIYIKGTCEIFYYKGKQNSVHFYSMTNELKKATNFNSVDKAMKIKNKITLKSEIFSLNKTINDENKNNFS